MNRPQILLLPLRTKKKEWLLYPKHLSDISTNASASVSPTVSRLPNFMVSVIQRTRDFLQKSRTQAIQQLGELKQEGFQGTLKVRLQRALARDPTEETLRLFHTSTPTASNPVEIIFPSHLSLVYAKEEFFKQTKHRHQHHWVYFLYSVLMIPVTLLMGILPGPNVFLAYNAYRLYCNYQAWRGSQVVLAKGQENTQFVASDELANIFQRDLPKELSSVPESEQNMTTITTDDEVNIEKELSPESIQMFDSKTEEESQPEESLLSEAEKEEEVIISLLIEKFELTDLKEVMKKFK